MSSIVFTAGPSLPAADQRPFDQVRLSPSVSSAAAASNRPFWRILSVAVSMAAAVPAEGAAL
jgi:hypothetical protein